VRIDGAEALSFPGDLSFDQVGLDVNGPGWRPDATYYFDDFAVSSVLAYRLPFVGLRYISNGPGCGQGSKRHQGFTAEAIDYELPIGTPVFAAENGVVELSGSVPKKDGKDLSGFGRFVKLRHADGSNSYYAHLSEAEVIEGESVSRGQLIARSGDTGKAKGAPHLHFQIMDQNGQPISIRTLPGTVWYSGDPEHPCDPKPKTRDGEATGPPAP
jgi:murein DD-endopeptidase MepM/ murein hydrolase activator NlpD